MNLINQKLSDKKIRMILSQDYNAYDYFFCDDVENAILEDLEDLDNLINAINNMKVINLRSLNNMLEVHKKLKLLRFGDFKK